MTRPEMRSLFAAEAAKRGLERERVEALFARAFPAGCFAADKRSG
jgi:hypothetical protein